MTAGCGYSLLLARILQVYIILGHYPQLTLVLLPSLVDRILEGLLEQGFTEFLRVGSLRKIAKNIIPFSPQADGRFSLMFLSLLLFQLYLTKIQQNKSREPKRSWSR